MLHMHGGCWEWNVEILYWSVGQPSYTSDLRLLCFRTRNCISMIQPASHIRSVTNQANISIQLVRREFMLIMSLIHGWNIFFLCFFFLLLWSPQIWGIRFSKRALVDVVYFCCCCLLFRLFIFINPLNRHDCITLLKILHNLFVQCIQFFFAVRPIFCFCFCN